MRRLPLRLLVLSLAAICLGHALSAQSDTAAAGQNHGIIDALMRIMLLGSEWVLYLLLALSVISVAIIIERTFYFSKHKIDLDSFLRDLTSALKAQDTSQAMSICRSQLAFEASMAAEGLSASDQGASAMEKSMYSYIAKSRSQMDRGLMILGTLGNNAPFIGLFGTVLGIIQAFHNLSLNPAGGPTVVMAGISEALVATAVGLFVAIPAVIAYNWFQRLISQRLNNAESIQNVILKHVDTSKPLYAKAN